MFGRIMWFAASLLLLTGLAVACAAPTAAPPVVQTVIVTATPPSAAPRAITVIANWGGGEKEAFQKVLDAFTAKTNIKVNYETSRNLEALTRTRVAGGNPP